MSKPLEDFIKTNRAEFDDLEPKDANWLHIEAELRRKDFFTHPANVKAFSLGFVLKVAAVIVLIMGSGFIFYLKFYHGAAGVDLAQINPEYAKQQVHYASLVESKRNELKALSKTEPQLYHEFSIEISKMDSTYKKLNDDLATSPDQEKVLHAMIRNLQIQTEVLNQQLSVIEQFNESKKEEQQHETQNI